MKSFRLIPAAIALAAAVGTAGAIGVAQAQMYVYQNAEGTRVYTDRRPVGVPFETVASPTGRSGAAPARSASQLFVYQGEDGGRLVTNQLQRDEALQLIATYGRPTAAVRCGLNAREAMAVGSGPFDAIIVQ
jgi:hypothetical protein